MFAKTKQGEKNLPKPAVWHLFLIKCPQIFFVSKSIHSDSPILPLSQSELLLKLFFYLYFMVSMKKEMKKEAKTSV